MGPIAILEGARVAVAAERMEATLFTCEDSLSKAHEPVEEPTTPLALRAIRRAREGDRDALRFLYARYADDVYRYSLTLAPNHDEARALTLRMFAELQRSIGCYREHDGAFGVWLRRMTCNIASNDDDY